MSAAANRRRKSAPQGRISFEEFLDWFDEDIHAEWIDGKVVVLSAPEIVGQDDERPAAPAGGLLSADRKAPPDRLISFEEFLAWADENTHAEWVDGEVYVASPASTEHQQIKMFLVQLLSVFLQVHPKGVVFDAPFLMRLPNRTSGREPDILVVLNEHAERITPTLLNGPADLVVEIISPESDGRGRGEKFVEYETAAIPEYWLIDPLRSQVHFYQLDADGHYQPAPIQDDIYHSSVLEGFWLRPAWFWQRPLPQTLPVLKELGLLTLSVLKDLGLL
jgi:Uma2 family endonuclease